MSIYNDYNLLALNGIMPTFSRLNQEFCVYDIQSTTCITFTTLFHYHTHNISPLIDKHGPDKLSCHIPAAPITKIDVCYMTDVKWISNK